MIYTDSTLTKIGLKFKQVHKEKKLLKVLNSCKIYYFFSIDVFVHFIDEMFYNCVN